MAEEAAADDAVSGNSEERLPEPSLFPLFHLPAAGEPSDPKKPLWLRNASFTVDVASLPAPARAPAAPSPSEDGGDSSSGESDGVPVAAKRPVYELVGSSSDSEERAVRGKRRRKRRKRGRESVRESEEGLGRKSGVDIWAAGGLDARSDKGYYFDSKGDRDNLAFGSLYR